MTVQKVDNEHALRQAGALSLLLQATHAEPVVQGTLTGAATGSILRSLERAANIADQISVHLRDQVLQLQDGWPEV